MTGNDPLIYHRYAQKLAHRYGGMHPTLSAEDAYQTAMVGLLELWRTRPGASEPLCFTAMRYAVLGTVRKLIRQPETQQFEDKPAPDQTEREALSNLEVARILAEIKALPAKQREALLLAIAGENLMALSTRRGKDPRLLLRSASHARKRLREWRQQTG